MIEPMSIEALLAADPLAALQVAIVSRLKVLLPGVSVVAHPGKVDVSELIAKSIVNAPGVGIGWSRVKPLALGDGSFSLSAEWVAYIVAEARPVAGRRIEKEAVALAIGAQLMRILHDDQASLWGILSGLHLPEVMPAPEMKPLFTVRDAGQGVAYYTVTWTQTVADVGATEFPTATGQIDENEQFIRFASDAILDAMRPYTPMEEPDA